MRKAIICLSILTICTSAWSKITLPVIIGDSMVLQRSMQVPIWGWATAGEKVSVHGSWPGAQTVSGLTNSNGKWMIKIQTPGAGGPYTLTIKGTETITLRGILIGEVWICSGQSNMEMPVKGWPDAPLNNAKEEVSHANYPGIRLFMLAKSVAYTPKLDGKGQWNSCNPVTASEFSATAYFFGRELSKRLKIPIGLIQTTWSGTIAEAWTSEPSLRKMGDFNRDLDRISKIPGHEEELRMEDKKNEIVWNAALANRDNTYAANLFDDKEWLQMKLPTTWEDAGHPELDGIVWFRKEIIIPAAWAGKSLKLDLGPIDDYDITYFNGQAIDSTLKDGFWNVNRNYTVPGNLVKSGKNVIAVKVTDNTGGGGIYGDKNLLRIYPVDGKVTESISLGGDWKFSIATIKKNNGIEYSPNQPSVLFNGMIAPLVPFAIKGAIWYQGESNVSKSKQYETLFPLMIADWRQQWKQGNFPFYFVQIAPYKYGGDSTEAAVLRDAQRKTLTASPQTGMAVTLDIGDAVNIHPGDKQTVGKRLSNWALNKTYAQKNITASGPLFQNIKVEKNKIVISFSNTDGGLRSQGKMVEHFEIAGTDNNWLPAKAIISADKVIVSNDSVHSPVAVRYAWAANTQASLFNGAGLPASSFSSQ